MRNCSIRNFGNKTFKLFELQKRKGKAFKTPKPRTFFVLDKDDNVIFSGTAEEIAKKFNIHTETVYSRLRKGLRSDGLLFSRTEINSFIL